MQIKEQGARRVAGIGGMHTAVGQLPNQPRVDGAKGQMALRRQLSGPLHVVQQPCQFGGREISIQHQACLTLNVCRFACLFQLFTSSHCASVLPNNGRRNGQARSPIPHHGGFALVGDADGLNILGLYACMLDHIQHHLLLGLPDFKRIVLDPPRLGKVLREFLLRCGDGPTIAVEQHRPRAGGALVKCKDVLHRRKVNRNSCSEKETIGTLCVASSDEPTQEPKHATCIDPQCHTICI